MLSYLKNIYYLTMIFLCGFWRINACNWFQHIPVVNVFSAVTRSGFSSSSRNCRADWWRCRRRQQIMNLFKQNWGKRRCAPSQWNPIYCPKDGSKVFWLLCLNVNVLLSCWNSLLQCLFFYRVLLRTPEGGVKRWTPWSRKTPRQWQSKRSFRHNYDTAYYNGVGGKTQTIIFSPLRKKKLEDQLKDLEGTFLHMP